MIPHTEIGTSTFLTKLRYWKPRRTGKVRGLKREGINQFLLLVSGSHDPEVFYHGTMKTCQGCQNLANPLDRCMNLLRTSNLEEFVLARRQKSEVTH